MPKLHTIAVRVDTSLCKVQVVDNGHGIDKVQLENVATRLYLANNLITLVVIMIKKTPYLIAKIFVECTTFNIC